jgi:transposase
LPVLDTVVELAASALPGRIDGVLADGAYDSRSNFDFLHEHEIEAVVLMRKNANAKRCGETVVIKERYFLGDEYWCFVHDYGRRWAIEGAFSAIKRTLGESLPSRRSNLRLREV